MPAPYDVVDLFAGCGGLTAGFHATGRFRPVAAVEMDHHAAATYAANFGPEHVFNGDIADWLEGPAPRAHVVVGGPPCQGFSALGKQDKDDPRNAMWDLYVEALVKIRPLVFVLENVPQFLKAQQFASLEAETQPGGRLSGYELEPFELNAADFGVAQNRKRAVVLGRSRELPPLGRPARSPEQLTVGEVLSDVPPTVDENNVALPGSLTDFAGQTVPGPFKMADLHITRKPTELSKARYRMIPPGGNRYDLDDAHKAPCWRKHNSGSADVMGRLWWDRPSVTIRTEFFKPEKGRYLHPFEHRPITHLEAALIQGFPEDFQWCGSKTSIARQIGNAVPVGLARAIAAQIHAHLDSHVR